MDPMPNSDSPDLTRLGLDNLAPTATHPHNKEYVKQLQKAQEREQRAIEAAEKGSEAETAVAALVQAYRDKLARNAESQPAYAYPSWRGPRPSPRQYLSAKAVGDAVEALWLQGKQDMAKEVLRRAWEDVADGPQRLSDQVRDEEAYLMQEAQDRALEKAQSQASGQITADEELARELQGTRLRRAPKRLAPNNLNARATDPYEERSLDL